MKQNDDLLLLRKSYLKHLEGTHRIKLTHREVDVLACIFAGRGAKKSASLLSISPKTVEIHTHNIMLKLNCNSRERIIDFIEKSNNSCFLKQCYASLSRREAFEQCLKNISILVGKGNYSCNLITWSEQNAVPILQQLERHLHLAGIKIAIYTRQGEPSFNDLIDNRECENDGHIFYILSKREIGKLQLENNAKEISRFFKKGDKKLETFTLISVDEDVVPTVIEEFKDVSYMDFQEGYYVSFFKLIEKIFPSTDFEKIISEFKEQYELYSVSLDKTSFQVNSEKMELRKVDNAFITTLKKRKNQLVLLSILSVSVFCVGIIVLNNNPENEAYSNLTFSAKQEINHAGDAETHSSTSNWNLPFLPDNYIERTTLIDSIWGRLRETDRIKQSTKIIGLTGLGGVGKTFLAMHAIHNPRQSYKFRAWFHAETESLLKANYFEIGEKFYLFAPNMSDNQKIREVKTWIEHNGDSLLVFDNAPNIEMLYDYLPKNAHIIITSRNYKIQNAIEIGVMKKVEALNLLKKSLPTILTQDQHFEQDSARLIIELNYIPLALAQAAAYMAENAISISNYLGLYSTERQNLLSSKIIPLGSKHEPIYVSWDINLESIKKIENGNKAIDLLNFIAFCYPENIPKSLLIYFLYGKDDNETRLELNKIIGILRKYSLLKTTEDSVSIHRLVSDWLKDKIDKQKHLSFIKKIKLAIEEIYPKDKENLEDKLFDDISEKDYHLINNLMPHIEAMLIQLEPSASIEEKISLYSLYADASYNVGDVHQSKLLLDKLVSIKKRHFKQDGPEVAKTLTNLAAIHNILGEPYIAERLLKKVLAINEKAYGADDIKNAEILQKLSGTYYLLGQGLKSLEVLEKAILINRKCYGNNHIKTAKILYGYALTQFLLGNFNDSKNTFNHVLGINKKNYGESHLEVGVVLNMLGWVHYALGDIIKSKEISEQALNMLSAHSRPDNIFVAFSQVNLGIISHELNNLEKSKAYLEAALRTRVQYYGPKHIWTAFAMADIGLIYASLGNREESKKRLNDALKNIENDYKSKQLWCSFLLNRVGIGYSILGEHETSRELFIRALDTIHKIYGKNHVFAATVTNNLGNVYRLLGNKKESEGLLKNALAVLQPSYGNNHIATAKVMANLALMHGDKESVKKQLLEDALIVFQNTYDDSHKDIQNTILELEKTTQYYMKINGLEKSINSGYFIQLPF